MLNLVFKITTKREWFTSKLSTGLTQGGEWCNSLSFNVTPDHLCSTCKISNDVSS